METLNARPPLSLAAKPSTPLGRAANPHGGVAVRASDSWPFGAMLTPRSQSPLINTLRIVIRPLAGEPLTLRVSPDATVYDLRAAVAADLGVPCCQQVLVLRGHQLLDISASLETLGLQDGEEVALLERPRHKITVKASDGARCINLLSSVPNGAHLQTHLELWLRASTTIGEIKDLVRERWPHYKLPDMTLHLNQGGICDSTWRVPRLEAALCDARTLDSLGLKQEGFLCVATQRARRLRILFQDGQALELVAPADCSEQGLRGAIAALPCVPAYAMKQEHARLVLKPGTYLGDSSVVTLTDLNVQDGATLYCLPAEGPCLGRPQPICTSPSGPYLCHCGQRDVTRLPDLARHNRCHGLVGAEETVSSHEEAAHMELKSLRKGAMGNDRAPFSRMLPPWRQVSRATSVGLRTKGQVFPE